MTEFAVHLQSADERVSGPGRRLVACALRRRRVGGGNGQRSDEDVAVVRAALPHRAPAKTEMTLAETSLQVRAASRAFDAMNVAVVLVDARARIIFANGLADAFLSRDGSLTDDGIHIRGADTPALRRLRQAIARCASPAAPRAAVVPVEIAAADGSTSLRIVLTPLGRNTIDAHRPPVGLAEPVVLLLIHDRARQRSMMRQRLGERFGLTAAEAGVVMEVIQGGTREDMARRLGVSVATVRTHLIRIFEKTGVRRQTELVRLALNSDRGFDSLDT